MSEELKVETAMEENFAELLEQSLKTLNNGDKVTGTVMAVGSTEIEVDLGTKHTAYIPLEDFSGDPNVKPEEAVKATRSKRSLSMLTTVRVLSVCPRSVLRLVRLGKRSRLLRRTRTSSRALSPRKTRAASSSMSRVSACSFRLPSPALPRAAIWASS